MQIQTLVNVKYQVVIPKEVRKKIKIKAGQKMNVDVVGEKIILSPVSARENWKYPEDYIKNLKDPWEGEDREKYLEEERNSWE